MKLDRINDFLNGKKLGLVLQRTRRASWVKYLQILLKASRPNGITMNEFASDLGERPQSIHPMLIRLHDRKALTRERRGNEFYYRLAEDIPIKDIEDLLNVIDSHNLPTHVSETIFDLLSVEDTKEGQVAEEDRQEAPEILSKMNTQKVSSKSDRLNQSDQSIDQEQSIESKERLLQLRLSKLPALPEFNPDWSEEQQNRWFALYAKIIELQTSKDD